jgi:polyisoprenoid-binding protein YceI
VLGYGAIFLYAKVLNDAPDELDESNLDAALAAGTEVTDTTSDSPPDASAWVTTDASELGYRVKEILFGVDTEGVGRTNEVDGTITIEGTQVTQGEFVVDVASITSDEGRRDGQFRGRIMSTDQFPEARFVLTEPIELGTEPVDGTAVTTAATGQLTLRGVTNPVTFDVEARLENGRIGVLGSIEVVFADYDITNPSTGGITTEDHGLLEFVLVFEPA